ncbi:MULTISPECIES: S1 family peptidase [Sphingomonas]|jgi:streptogrisin C|uniref:S1 family peptidase n=1 Tax=Sphingomonas TaxID=13687 RepID=UPI001F5221E7|nr:S1 family peptidase [Sphingomonas sp. Sph1(2015)]
MLVMMPGGAWAQALAPLDGNAALALDAAEYATLSGQAPMAAARELAVQEASVPLTDALKAEFADRLAGLSVGHAPFHIDILLTGDVPVADRVVQVAGSPVLVRFRTGAYATHHQLVIALALHQTEIRASLTQPPGIGVDPRIGALVVMVARADAEAEPGDALRDRIARIAGVPVRIATLDTSDSDLADLQGGARLTGIDPGNSRRYACTSGFVVRRGSDSAIVTAAHCPDDLVWTDAERRQHPLPFLGQWGWGYQDVQVNGSPAPLSPAIWSDTTKTISRRITGQRTRDQTRAGDIVCHRGERTGYSCAEVWIPDFAPAGDLCGGGCTPTWVAVRGPSCRSGDSGGPVFLGGIAYGIVKGGSYRGGDGSCAFYYYMSVDFLPDGWSLATG